MKKYEAVFVFNTRKVKDEGKDFLEEITQVIEDFGGKLESSDFMGRKQFAYEMNKMKAGIYWNYIITMNPEDVEMLRKKFRLDERVLRMLIINYDRPE